MKKKRCCFVRPFHCGLMLVTASDMDFFNAGILFPKTHTLPYNSSRTVKIKRVNFLMLYFFPSPIQ